MFLELNSKCTQNSDCKTTYSECLEKVCKCDKNHYENGDKCNAGKIENSEINIKMIWLTEFWLLNLFVSL